MAGPEGERPRVERTAKPSTPAEQHKPQMETEPAPSQVKRPRGRPRLPIPSEDKQRLQKRGRNDRYYQKHGDTKRENTKRYQQDHREWVNKYMRDYYKKRKQQREAELRQSQQDQQSEAVHIFP
jgi:hypothetical protein